MLGLWGVFLLHHFICCYYTVVCTIIKITGENGTRKERKEPCARASSSAAVGPGSPASRLSSPACHLLAVRGWCAAPGSTPVASLYQIKSERPANQHCQCRHQALQAGTDEALMNRGFCSAMQGHGPGVCTELGISPVFCSSSCSGRQGTQLPINR